MFIDTHCHISKEDYENPHKIIEDAYQNNVKRLIISGCSKETIKESIEISHLHDNVYLTLGFHPEEANNITKEDIENLKKDILNEKRVIGIGEIGLDYHWEKENKDKQKKLFEDQLKLAEELDLPIVIHSRDAFQDTYDILKKHKCRGVIHCFSGNIENAKMYLSLGFYLGIGGVLTFKNSKLKEVIKEIDINRIVVETDCPYLTPEPIRGIPNEPKYIPYIVEAIAKIKEIKIEEVEEILEKNTKRIYKIS